MIIIHNVSIKELMDTLADLYINFDIVDIQIDDKKEITLFPVANNLAIKRLPPVKSKEKTKDVDKDIDMDMNKMI